MKTLFILSACVVGSCFAQQEPIGKAFLGVWNLDLSRSKFPPGTARKGSQIQVNENGYVLTNQDPAPGTPAAVGVAFVGGECYVVGPIGPSCTATRDTPRRANVNIKMGDAVVLKIEVELQGEATMMVKQTNLMSPTPVVSELVYTKVTQAPAATKK